ncbi:cupin domain-containing protein [Paenibacillus sp. PR3]|uniref:Cupin domain-containing protein n=1 Tax=Paenibacillus terricola TaxID=2763503 RepID=A0ABR8MSW2_9BACL|nr:cupin domain-containing protein [Paenibacillus terricola]MBD3919062.1 cupin domain-containing protein [Paenibacillus terricola]
MALSLDLLLDTMRHGSIDYCEFLRIPSMSAGVYRLPAGAVDTQSPHTEDELYYIVSGRASITVGANEHEVRTGSIVLVEANVPHRFHSITEELVILVLFAPAEYSNRG